MSIEKILAFVVGPGVILVTLLFTIILPEKSVVEELNVSDQKNVVEKEVYNQLKTESDNTKQQLQKKETIIDSLTKVIEFQKAEFKDKDAEIENLKTKVADKEKQTANIKELAKTFSTMKADEMAPILRNLDDQTVILIYENMSNRVRKNYLLALPSQRAASLAKKLASIN